jgi:hypothetical protein
VDGVDFAPGQLSVLDSSLISNGQKVSYCRPFDGGIVSLTSETLLRQTVLLTTAIRHCRLYSRIAGILCRCW